MVVTILATGDDNDDDESVFGRAECGSEERGCGGCEYETTTAMGCCSRRGLDDDDDDDTLLLLTVEPLVDRTTELLLLVLRDVVIGMERSPWRRRPT